VLGLLVKVGSPSIDNVSVRQAVKAIENVFAFSSGGGNLHIVIEDWNCDDDSLTFCYDFILREENPDKRASELDCCSVLQSLTEEERYSTLALYEEYWKENF
jgi:hypothetical protein